MGGNGTRPIPGRVSTLAARAVIASFVTWGLACEMTRPSVSRMLVCLDPSKVPEAHPGVKYTIFHAKVASHGWPLWFSFGTDLRESYATLFPNEFRHTALAGDLAFAGLLVFAAWSIFPGWRRQFSLADIIALTASVAVMMAFQIRAWNHQLDCAKIAIDLGVFSTALMMLRYLCQFSVPLVPSFLAVTRRCR